MDSSNPPASNRKTGGASRPPPGAGAPFTLRDRWLRTMHYQTVDRRPNFEFGYWNTLYAAWHEQGLPRRVTNESEAYAFFGIEDWIQARPEVGLFPPFETKVLREEGDFQVIRGPEGATRKRRREGHRSIDHYLDFGLKDRRAWEEAYKPRLDPDTPGRIPQDWPQLAARYHRREAPLAVNIGSMVGKPRNWMGFERIALTIYDDPELLEEIVETCCRLVCGVLEKILPEVAFDFGAGWEDICFNSGPIVGERFMREVVGPRYRRITDLLHKHGCHITWTDCDGNLSPIADVFLDNGINCFFPAEVHGGTDPVALRKRYGTRALFQGGVDKLQLRNGPEAIDAELERLRPVVEEGGFVPSVDHRVPADVPLANYLYYMKRKRELFRVGGTPQYDESDVRVQDGRIRIPELY